MSNETINNSTKSPCNTLPEVVDEYLIHRGVDKKKYYARYLVISKRIFQKIFWNTLWVTKSVWQPLKKGEPYNYIDIPSGTVRLFSVETVDDCGKLVPLWYNSLLNVIPKPTEKKCDCSDCNCGGLCEDVNSFQMTTTLLFTINGVNYYEKIWLKYCKNGDVIEYKEIPTKKYLDYKGDSGDYNQDYNNDFDIANNPFGNFEIITEKFQRKICQLTVRPCGCPEETPENEQQLIDNCGCFLPLLTSKHKKRLCDKFLDDPNPNCYGQVKLSECGNKIYYKPNTHHHQNSCITGTNLPVNKLPDYLLVNCQSSGLPIDDQVLVPDYCLDAMWAGIDWGSKRFNNTYSLAEKQQAKYEFNDAINEVIKFLNPLSLEVLGNIQDAPIRW